MLPSNDVLVLRATDVERVRTFFQSMGLQFTQEKHGSGPRHYACQVNGRVLEIYPTRKNEDWRFLESANGK